MQQEMAASKKPSRLMHQQGLNILYKKSISISAPALRAHSTAGRHRRDQSSTSITTSEAVTTAGVAVWLLHHHGAG